MSRTDANHSPASNDAWTGWIPPVEAGTLVAASHGTGSPVGQRAIRALVQAVDAARPGLRVAEAFVDVQTPDVPAVLSSAGLRPRIVPLLLSTGYHTRHDLAEAAAGAQGTTVSRALGPDARLADVLALRLKEAGLRKGDQVIMACAGSTDAQGVADCHTMAKLLSQTIGAKVEAAFVSAAEPSVETAVARAQERKQRGWFSPRRRAGRVVVSTFLMAPGHFAARVAGSDADVVAQPLLVPGLPVPNELVEIVLERYDQP
ncbi:sirohydrochlorin chelatase [Zhihengliuella halotolerans]|uniref:Sirohydrochlorin ferrochelatase n=1 Tax=Zhihengliuella halotolerans TaxID=370736 RepID=A0A4Q8AEG1_9MICC|nr:CbiX/SirB N-terminal domain-containing protein [Zhihengliuella halotolerans]RZU62564.1 sirohydrochlorin ferrochelatase [Zhihengliuella halotolerans]